MSAADVLVKHEECLMSSIHFQARLAADSSLAGGSYLRREKGTVMELCQLG
jgi:hypothetical protein